MENVMKAEDYKEAIEVLALIVAEFKSDPMSVQCFDLRLVERAKKIVAKCTPQPSSRNGASHDDA